MNEIYRLDFTARVGQIEYRERLYFLSELEAQNYVAHQNAANIPMKILSITKTTLDELLNERNKEK